jgi:hypothetical protein
MMDWPHEQATSDPDRTLELRDNLADFLKIVFAEADAGILETVPAEKVAAELGLNWQSVPSRTVGQAVAGCVQTSGGRAPRDLHG